jgi:hypothetical protein
MKRTRKLEVFVGNVGKASPECHAPGVPGRTSEVDTQGVI